MILGLQISCNSNRKVAAYQDITKVKNDTVRIANDNIEYEVIIIDPGFVGWLNSYARPRGYYSQNYLEARNEVWILEWNRRAMLPTQFNPNLYMMTINYDKSIDYGYEVNYMIFNYLVYFQQTHNQNLGTFQARI